jgi:hypothetical protein
MDGTDAGVGSSAASRRRHGRRPPVWLLLLVFVGVALAGVVALARGADAGTGLPATLEPSGTPGGTSLKTTTCAKAYTALSTASHATRLPLAIGPLLSPSITATNLVVAASPTTSSCTTLTLEGTATLFGKTVHVLVVGEWATASATTPTFTFAFSFGSVPLNDLVAPGASGSSFGVSLSAAWVGWTTDTSTSAIDPTSLPSTNTSFFTGLSGTFSVAASGLSFAGRVTASGSLATALTKVGVTPPGIQLTGSLTGSLSHFSKTAPPTVGAQLQITASVTTHFTTLPSWLTVPTHAFTLSVTGASDKSWSVTLAGSATVTIPGSSAPSGVTVTITVTNGPVLTLTATLGTVDTAFGESWLTLDKASLSITVQSSGATATLSATATVDGATFGVSVTLSTSGDVSGNLSVSTGNKRLSIASLASALSLGTPPSGTTAFTLTSLDVSLSIKKGGPVTIAVEGEATIQVTTTFKPKVAVLVRYESGSKGSLIVAARPTGKISLQEIVPGLPTNMSMTLPKLAFLFSTKTTTLASTSVDTATFDYFRGIYCPATTKTRASSTCHFTVAVQTGVSISASVTMPASLTQLVCNLVKPGQTSTSCITGPVTIEGHVPLFGKSAISLKVSLPTVSITSDTGPVKQVTVFFEMSKPKTGFTLEIGGTLVFLVPGKGTANCPASVSPGATHVCLHLTVNGALTFGGSGVSVKITAALTGDWTLPASSHATWMTIQNVTLQIGVTAGEGVGLTLGARGTFVIGPTDLGLAFKLEITPEPPWVNLLGVVVKSKTGLSTADLYDLYHDVTGDTIPSGILPPIALKNLYFSYASVTTAPLGLCTGLHISADLVITKGAGTSELSKVTPSGPSTCGSIKTPTKSLSCTTDPTTCLASVMLTISPTGISGGGHLHGWKAGPLTFYTTTFSFILTTSEVEFHIAGGGKLLTPFTYNTEGTAAPTWATGSLTLYVGTQKISVTGKVGIIGLGSATISGSGSFDLSNPGFTFTDWLTTVKTFFTTTIGGNVKHAMNTVATTVTKWYNTYVASSVNSLASDLQGLYTTISNALQGTWKAIYSLYLKISTKITSFNSFVNSITLTFLDIPTNAIFNDALHGIGFGGWLCTTLGCLVPSFHIPGLCTYTGRIEGSPLCAAPITQLVTVTQQQIANPSVASRLATTSLSVPVTAGTMVRRIHAVDPTTNTAHPITCAMGSVNYTTGSSTPTNFQVNTLGNTLTIKGPNVQDLANSSMTTTNEHTIDQNTLDGLSTGNNTGSCTPPSKSLNIPLLTMSVNHSWIYEGESATASGVVATTGVTSVTVDWGDGTATQSVPVPSTGKFSVSHVYADETGVTGGTSPFTVTASAGSLTPVTRKISVLDAPLKVDLASLPTSVDVMNPVTVSGTLATPEAGEVDAATISWGDGTANTTVTVQPTGSFSATHVYERLVPSGAPSRQEPIAVTVAEPDGTSVRETTAVVVDDVAPSGTAFSATGGAITSRGVVFTHANTPLRWSAEANDVSPQQILGFDVNWADGTKHNDASVQGSTSGPNGTGVYTYAVASGFSHTFGNACVYQVQTSVTDDDTLSAPTVDTPVVVTANDGNSAAVQKTTAFWIKELGTPRPPLNTRDVDCYVEIAQYLSPYLGTGLSAAVSVLQPNLSRMTTAQKAAAMLRSTLLTVLLDFANGDWNWTQGVGPHQTPFETLVNAANAALGSGSVSAMQAATQAIYPLA